MTEDGPCPIVFHVWPCPSAKLGPHILIDHLPAFDFDRIRNPAAARIGAGGGHVVSDRQHESTSDHTANAAPKRKGSDRGRCRRTLIPLRRPNSTIRAAVYSFCPTPLISRAKPHQVFTPGVWPATSVGTCGEQKLGQEPNIARSSRKHGMVRHAGLGFSGHIRFETRQLVTREGGPRNLKF